MTKTIARTLSSLFLALLLGLPVLTMANAGLDQKLEQCQAAFVKSRSADIPQGEARKAEEEHIRLMVSIMAELNDRTTMEKPLTNDEIRTHLRVMGRLVEMLGARALPHEMEWYVPSR